MIEWLERSAAEDQSWFDEVGVAPWLRTFRSHPRFIDLAYRENVTVLPR